MYVWSRNLAKQNPDMDDTSKENVAQLKDAGKFFVRDNAEVLEGIVNRLVV
jgi:hypothetical protein